VAEHIAVNADVTLAIAFKVGTDKSSSGAFENAEDDADRPEVGAARLAGDLDQDGVTGRSIEGIAFTDMEVGARRSAVGGVRADIPRAGGGAAERADEGAVGLAGRTEWFRPNSTRPWRTSSWRTRRKLG
jgi:hypothetical protein